MMIRNKGYVNGQRFGAVNAIFLTIDKKATFLSILRSLKPQFGDEDMT